ncbi:MAG: EAL domain-containing protein, partial [Pseudomonadota bacterium]
MATGMESGFSSLRKPTRGVFPGVKPEALEADLLRALDRREIEVLFQPQFSCATGAVVGAEALARWQHPSLGEIGARDLFAIAERAALVAPLSRHVVARALEDAESWPEELGLSLNITPEELGDVRFAADFAELIGGSDIAPGRLMLEITEDVLLRNLNQAADALSALRGLGFKTALDDFGAGFCNFRYLKELPL